MSEPKLILPLLEGFAMGQPMSEHQGVCCCPAMELESQQKYIVKIISIPSSQTQLEALLLTGAYSDNEAALAYFKELADDTVEEAQILQRLARLEGFYSYNNWQVAPMEDGVGYHVYLKAPYRLTLDRYLSQNTMTHLAAVNLGLDLCAALSACRRSGYLYVDIKPGNIFISDEREYRLGDLGFIGLSSLQYASLPEKYRSSYTAPEITDAYSALNTTLDTYALGLILYQIYNNGQLPFEGSAPAEPLPPPPYADYEMAEIILKACAIDPADRWEDPSQMGQALVNYMQRNSINDIPIIPPAVEIAEEADIEADAPAEEEEAFIAAEAEEADNLEVSAEIEETDDSEVSAEEAVEVAAEETVSEEEAEVLSVLGALLQDETVPTEESAAELSDTDLSEETSQILAHADELIAHELPQPVVVPEPVDVPIPAPIQLESEEDTQSTPAETAVAVLTEEALEPQEELLTDETDPSEDELAEDDDGLFEDETDLRQKKKKRAGLVVVLASILLVLLLGLGGYLFYTDYYLQSIDGITLRATESQLTVLLDTDTDNSLLTVYCTDTYGNKKQASVENNIAQFTGLRPDTSYKIAVEVNGFHKLTGVTTGTHTTASQTLITSFTAVTGAEDGSVILNFAVQGPETSAWRVRYAAEDEPEKTVDFTGHLVTVTGLTVGKEYTFLLESATALYLEGTDTLKHTASNIIYPQDLTALGFQAGTLTATWNAPEGIAVNGWTVRCYNDTGYDHTITVTDTTAAFEGLDPALAYTIEVKAEGMTVGSRTFVFANSITFKDIQASTADRTQLVISWGYEGTAPKDGWQVLYRVDGSEQNVIQCDSSVTSVVISPLIPGGHYDITIQPSGGGTVFGGAYEYDASAAPLFSGYWVSYEHMVFSMCRRPALEIWDRTHVKNGDYTTNFHTGEKASFVVRLNHEYTTSNDKIEILFVIRDGENVPVSFNTITRTWTNMWYKGYGTLDIPVLPEAVGNYSLEIYYNGAFVTTQAFTVS